MIFLFSLVEIKKDGQKAWSWVAPQLKPQIFPQENAWVQGYQNKKSIHAYQGQIQIKMQWRKEKMQDNKVVHDKFPSIKVQ